MPDTPGVTSEDAVTVVVADDQSAVREGLVLLLGTLPGITVAGEAADGDAAVELVAKTNPRVVLMDLNMPGCDGVTATARITAEHPGTRVVVLTTYADDESIIGALRAGALGYLTKDATRAEIGRAIQAAAAGQAVLDPGVQQRLLSAAARAPEATTPAAERTAPSGDDELTPREAEVLKLIAAGQSNREIARTLFVSEATVKTHVNRIFAKTGSRDRAQAIRYAYTRGYADPGQIRTTQDLGPCCCRPMAWCAGRMMVGAKIVLNIGSAAARDGLAKLADSGWMMSLPGSRPEVVAVTFGKLPVSAGSCTLLSVRWESAEPGDEFTVVLDADITLAPGTGRDSSTLTLAGVCRLPPGTLTAEGYEPARVQVIEAARGFISSVAEAVTRHAARGGEQPQGQAWSWVTGLPRTE